RRSTCGGRVLGCTLLEVVHPQRVASLPPCGLPRASWPRDGRRARADPFPQLRCQPPACSQDGCAATLRRGQQAAAFAGARAASAPTPATSSKESRVAKENE